MAARKQPLHSLTGLRFVAALAVSLLHLTDVGLDPAWMAGMQPYFETLCNGVTFFFVLSGFILAYNYLDEMRAPTAPALRRFYAARWARVYPVYFLVLAFAMTTLPLAALWEYRRIWFLWTTTTNFTLTQAFLPDPLMHFGFYGVAWSLSVEAFFYLCFPVIAWIISRWVRPGWEWPIAIALCAVSIGYHGLVQGRPWTGWACYVFPLARLPDFLVGMLLGRAYLRRGSHPNAARRAAVSAELLAAASIAALAICSPALPLTLRVCAAATPGLAFAVWTFACGGGPLARLAATAPAVYLGEISYSYYLLHPLTIKAWKSVRSAFGGDEWHAAVQMAAVCVATVAASSACYYLWEMPARRWCLRMLSPSRADVRVAPSALRRAA